MGGDIHGDVTSQQLVVDAKNLVSMRLIPTQGRDKKIVAETQFNRYVKANGGWVAAEVKFFVDGKPTTTEEYSDIQAGMSLNPDLWNPDKWTTVDKTYYKKK